MSNIDFRSFAVPGYTADQLREWKKDPPSDRWVFEKVLSAVSELIGNLPRKTEEDEFWFGVEGQFFAELLWDTCPPDLRKQTSEAITYTWGEAEDRKDWLKKYMRLNRAISDGKLHALRIPERDLTRRKSSQRERGRWYYTPELDALHSK